MQLGATCNETVINMAEDRHLCYPTAANTNPRVPGREGERIAVESNRLWMVIFLQVQNIEQLL